MEVLKSGTVIAGRFLLQRPLGAGARATVWLSSDLATKNDCVIRLEQRGQSNSVLDEQYELYRSEVVNRLYELRLPELMLPLDIGEADGYSYEIFPNASDLTSLDHVISSRGSLELAAGIEVMRSLARSLTALHSKGVIHTDIKPANILLSAETCRKIHLIDFGMAQKIGPELQAIWGTWRYLHPALKRPGTDDHSSAWFTRILARGGPYIDIYAMGVVALEVFAGFSATSSLGDKIDISDLLQANNEQLKRSKPHADTLASLIGSMLAVTPDDGVSASDVLEVIESLEKSIFSSSTFRVDLIDPMLLAVLARHPELMRTLDWRSFEKLLAHILENMGYEVELQRGTKDGGVDIFAVKRVDPLGPHRYLLQAKRSARKIGVEPVRELLFLHNKHQVTRSCLATTSTFTSGAWELGNEHEWQLELKDFRRLQEWVQEAAKPVAHNPIPAPDVWRRR